MMKGLIGLALAGLAASTADATAVAYTSARAGEPAPLVTQQVAPFVATSSASLSTGVLGCRCGGSATASADGLLGTLSATLSAGGSYGGYSGGSATAAAGFGDILTFTALDPTAAIGVTFGFGNVAAGQALGQLGTYAPVTTSLSLAGDLGTFDYSQAGSFDAVRSFTFTGPMAVVNLSYLLSAELLNQPAATLTTTATLTIAATNARFAVASGPAPAVPEPATWATMVAGFGVVGQSLRRRSWTARTAG